MPGVNRDEREANIERVRRIRDGLRSGTPPDGEPPVDDDPQPLRLVEPSDGEPVESPDDRWNERADLQ